MSAQDNARDAGKRGDLEFGTLPNMVRLGAERHPNSLAICDGDVSLTYAQFAAEVSKAAKALMALGVESGDRVAIWAPNMWEWAVAALAIHSTGGVMVPINTRYKGHEASYLLNKSRAKALFTVTGFLDTDYVALLRKTGETYPHLATTIVLRGEAPGGTQTWSDFLAKGSAITDAAAEQRAQSVKPDDLADILFTSGTTGNPKGVMCTHAQNLRAFRDWADTTGLRAGDRYLVVLPFFHSFGYKAGMLAGLMMGATLFPLAVFDVGAALERIGKDKITVMPGPPALYQSILARPDFKTFDLSTLRLAVTGAAAIPVELIHKMKSELKFETVITGYGLTETTGIATMCRYDDDAETIATTSGRAIPHVEVIVADDNGNEVPRGEPGEILVRGYNVMKGYFDDAAETAATIDAKGWLHTGDIGNMDPRGYIKITDRKKDMFIVGGFNAYPVEIEHILLRHPDIAQVAVVGMPDERMGEVGAAFVVLKPGATATPNTLLAWSREQMANYKVPRKFEMIDALPVNATGKVLKYQLRQRVTAAS